jgi:H+-transporting ATPase
MEIPAHLQDATPGSTTMPAGLTDAEARRRLQQYGANRVEEERWHPLAAFLSKFWAPVPWMLEATVVLEILMRKRNEAIVIASLLIFNAILSSFQENQANRALGLLRKRLSVQARALRDGHWQLVAAEQIVPGDVIHLRLGDLAPADVRLLDGRVQADESDLTGESLPVEKMAGATVYAGSRLTHGEANAEVTATGPHTYFGKTAELVKTAKTVSHLQEIIFAVVKYLVILDAALVGGLLLYAAFSHLLWSEILPFALILLVASVPVALPATFTVATALGALEMSHRGVLVTRLSAIEEAASMDVLCTDKTGTITQNRLKVTQIRPAADRSAEEVLRMGALASDPATQDPIDLAILEAAKERKVLENLPRRIQFIPFDPAAKRSEGVYQQASRTLRVVKGAPDELLRVAGHSGSAPEEVVQLAGRGARVLAVAAGTGDSLELLGFLGLEDPIREDSRALVQDLRNLGVRVMMVTGDGAATARAVSMQVGIGSRVGSVADLQNGAARAAEQYDVFAGVFPENKYRLVEALQRAGHIVGMTGDGVNDAPALKQAEAGIAVATATDVAKAAASIVLTESGLTGVVRAVETGRRIYQRMLTYTLNKIIKTLQIVVLLSVGLMLTGTFVVTPLLVVLLLFANDFVTMSIAADRVSFSSHPDRWDIRTLMLTASVLALLVLSLSFAVVFLGRDALHLPLRQLQTLVFLMLVFTGQGTVYLVRERSRFWKSVPGRWLLFSSLADILAVSILATRGILMAPIPWSLVGSLFGLVLAFLFVIDSAKVHVFRRFGVR